jgi:RNA polymerase sigma-70 factor (ECF subfamily)
MAYASESELVARCQAGDQQAFEALVDRYKNLVFGVISQVVLDRSRVDDLAQEVFLKIHRGLPAFRGDAKLSTWIYRIVRNVCCEPRSRKGDAISISLDELDDDGRPIHQPAVVDRAFADLEMRDQVEKAVAQLPDDWRLLISAHYFGGLQYHELAETFEMPIGTVKAQLHRAKHKLRAVIMETRAAR